MPPHPAEHRQNATTTIAEPWPSLPYEAWKDTYVTLHLWTQIVGKVALALAPPINHSWGVALHVTSRGLSTRCLPYGDRSFAMEFDFVDHQLAIRTSDGRERAVLLGPRTVADFYREVMSVLAGMGFAVTIWPMAVEILSPIRLDTDTVHDAYDPVFAHRCWRINARIADVLTRERSRFIGKCSPTHFFWGGFDLAVSRFSGRPAPPREGPAFMREAYSHEVISHGFWPGSDPVFEPALYAYAVAEPSGFKEANVQPNGAFYHSQLGEYILPYEVVRTAESPEDAIAAFVDSTYEQAASLAKWDRAALERHTEESHHASRTWRQR